MSVGVYAHSFYAVTADRCVTEQWFSVWGRPLSPTCAEITNEWSCTL